MATSGPRSYPELAQAIGRSVPTLHEYRRRGCPVRKVDGVYPVEAIAEWIRRNIRTKAGRPRVRGPRRKKPGQPAAAGPDEDGQAQAGQEDEDYEELYIRERALKTQAQREREQLKHQIESGQYIPLEEVRKRDIERISVVKSGLLALPRRLAQELMGLTATQIEVLLRTRFRELLERFAAM
jgi:phage terminase Nu1 subunit (DNA packaging protein)